MYHIAGDACTQPRNPGTAGTANLQRWYFDPNSRQCLQFVYSGMRGNQNNFVTREDCEQQCPG